MAMRIVVAKCLFVLMIASTADAALQLDELSVLDKDTDEGSCLLQKEVQPRRNVGLDLSQAASKSPPEIVEGLLQLEGSENVKHEETVTKKPVREGALATKYGYDISWYNLGTIPGYEKEHKPVPWTTVYGRLGKIQVGSFLNYGFYSDPLADCAKVDNSSGDMYGFRSNVYASLANLGGGLKDKEVLEVGSGRGAGGHILSSCYCAKRYVGMDLDQGQVNASNAAYVKEDSCPLKYVQGDAQKLPFANASFDVVINVESSHTYPNFEAFVNEVARVLRPGGVFMMTDFRWKLHMPFVMAALKDAFPQSTIKNMTKVDISKGILEAINIRAPDWQHLCGAPSSSSAQKMHCLNLAGGKGSWLDHALSLQLLEYFQLKIETV